MRQCNVCHAPIALARLAALPTATTCVTCSTEQPVKGYMTWEHKTAPVFQVVTPNQHAWLQARDRKGMRSGLPMSSRSASATTFTTAYSAPTTIAAAMPTTDPYASVPRARTCPHTERPQASSAGKCLECATTYYAIRANFVPNTSRAVKKSLTGS